METPEKSYTIEFGKSSIHEIEFFVDFVCDQLQINETYSGNILVALSEFFNVMNGMYSKEKCVISYSTDYQCIKIVFKPTDNQVVMLLKEEIEISNVENSSRNASMYLIHSLVDNIEIIDDHEVNFIFDISAVHNKVLHQRKNLLTDYFDHSSPKLVNNK
jgi:hypothetical protein